MHMRSIPKEKLAKLVERSETIQAELNQGVNQAARAKLAKEFSDLSPIVEAIRELEAAEKEVSDLKGILDDPAADKEMAALARSELEALEPRLANLEAKLKILLLPKDAADE